MLVVGRRGRAGKVKDLVHLEVERLDNIVAHQLEAWMGTKCLHIGLAASKIVIQANNLVAGGKQPLAEVGTQKAGPPGD